MTRLLIDTSILLKWFHAEGESELTESRAIRDAHLSGDVDAYVIDLAIYELGNVLARSLRWPALDIANQLDDLRTIVGPPVTPSGTWWRRAADLADAHELSFYDASWAAAAIELDVALVSADRRLVKAGLAETPATCASRLRLDVAAE